MEISPAPSVIIRGNDEQGIGEFFPKIIHTINKKLSTQVETATFVMRLHVFLIVISPHVDSDKNSGLLAIKLVQSFLQSNGCMTLMTMSMSSYLKKGFSFDHDFVVKKQVSSKKLVSEPVEKYGSIWKVGDCKICGQY